MDAFTMAFAKASTCFRATRYAGSPPPLPRSAGPLVDPLQDEKDKMDIFHKFFLVARRDALHSTPFIPNYDEGPRILDLGTGTGIWAIDMAEWVPTSAPLIKAFQLTRSSKYRNSEVRGWDLAMIQPTK